MKLSEMSKEELLAFKNKVQEEYDGYKAQSLALNMARGKPSTEQLDITEGLLTCISTNAECCDGSIDTRNYGNLDGLPSAKRLLAPILGVSEQEMIVFGNSSLNVMYDAITKFMMFGVDEQSKPWKDQGKIKWLCPVPGYDRHFLICEQYGIEMINITTDDNGPDMDMVEKLVAEDDSIKGIWCVPMYSNPTGITYSDGTVKRFATLKPKAEDFRIFWDNAYAVHHINDTPDKLMNLLDECKAAGCPDRVLMFASTSKITHAGAGVGVMGASEANIKYFLSLLTVQTIGYDKMNQLRHVKFFGDFEGLKAHMEKHKALIAPRFKVVLDTLESELGELDVAKWKNPNGGYFISFDAMSGTAKRIVALCKEAGVVLTGAGATFPYGKDPEDSNIRIAPTFPPVEELKIAAKLFAVCVKLASAEKLLAE